MACKRCGKCCKEDVWLGSDLTWDEKQMLISERAKLPEASGCRMLYYKDDVAVCLIHELLGSNKKETVCQQYKCKEQQ